MQMRLTSFWLFYLLTLSIWSVDISPFFSLKTMQMFFYLNFWSIGNGQIHIANITRRQWRWFHCIVYMLLFFYLQFLVANVKILGEMKSYRNSTRKSVQYLCLTFKFIIPILSMLCCRFQMWGKRNTIINRVPRIIKKYDKCCHCW